jgi:glycosyltransferase involved in cell wall biosynthesis
MLVLALRRIVGARTTAVIHIAELRSPVFLYAAALRRLFARRVVLVHSAFGMLHDKPRSRRRLFDPMFMGFMLRSVDIFLAQNDHEADVYRERCRRYRTRRARIELLPLHTPGPPPEVAAAANDHALRMRLRTAHGVPTEAFVCIFLGRLWAEKGILRTIDAFEICAATLDRPAMLLIVGHDHGFQSAIAAHVAACGAVQRIRIINDVYAQRFEYYALADLFLGFPTIHEETMLASVEALSCGTPVLVSSEADIPFVEAAGGGFVVEFSVARAAECMGRVAASPAGFRQRALSVARSRFAEQSTCARFQSIIERAARARDGG